MIENLIIIGICVLAIAFIILLFILLYIFVFSKKKMEKQYNQFGKNFVYLHDQLTSQDKQYLERIDTISRTNLLYVDVYEKYLKTYLTLKERYDEPLSKAYNELKICLSEKNKKEFKKIYNENVEVLEDFKKQLLKLDGDLVLVIKPEDDCRQSASLLKDKYRAIKLSYTEHEEELKDVNSIFEKLFKNIDKKFDEFEETLDVAQFDEAKEFLQPLTKVLNEIEIVIEKMPGYLEDTNVVVPQMIAETANLYQKYLSEQLPLKHLDVENSLIYSKNTLKEIREGFEKLNIHKVGEKLETVKTLLKDKNEKMNEENDAKNSFMGIYENVMNNYRQLEKNIVLLNNKIPNYEVYYLITQHYKTKLAVINDTLDSLGKVKRKFDYLLNGMDKTYYTDLLNKIIDLEKGVNSLNEEYNEYVKYLDSLKIDTNYAYKLNNETYLKTKKCELMLREFNNEIILNNYKERIDKIYEIMDSINLTIRTMPINTETLNNYSKELEEVSKTLLNEVEELNNFKLLSTNNILFINREQYKFSDIHNYVSQAETLFTNCEFKNCYELTEEVLNKLKDKERVK